MIAAFRGFQALGSVRRSASAKGAYEGFLEEDHTTDIRSSVLDPGEGGQEEKSIYVRPVFSIYDGHVAL